MVVLVVFVLMGMEYGWNCFARLMWWSFWRLWIGVVSWNDEIGNLKIGICGFWRDGDWRFGLWNMRVWMDAVEKWRRWERDWGCWGVACTLYTLPALTRVLYPIWQSYCLLPSIHTFNSILNTRLLDTISLQYPHPFLLRWNDGIAIFEITQYLSEKLPVRAWMFSVGR